MSSAADEPTLPVVVAKPPKPPKPPKGPVPPALKPGYRDAAQRGRLELADQAAWSLLAKLRFVPPAALKALAYENLGFPFSDLAFRGRMLRHRSDGYWGLKRLGSHGRPESVLFLTKRGIEHLPSTYGVPAPSWNADTARRGWLRSWAWARLTKAGGTVTPGIEQLKDPQLAPLLAQLDASPATTSSNDALGFVFLWKKVLAGRVTSMNHDYVRLGGGVRTWLLVDDIHKTIELQVAALRQHRLAIYSAAKVSRVIFRPVDDMSCWSTGETETHCTKCSAPKIPGAWACGPCGARHGRWTRRSGRLVQATKLLEEAGFTTSEFDGAVPYMQTEP
jgi:hypothetical protein